MTSALVNKNIIHFFDTATYIEPKTFSLRKRNVLQFTKEETCPDGEIIPFDIQKDFLLILLEVQEKDLILQESIL